MGVGTVKKGVEWKICTLHTDGFLIGKRHDLAARDPSRETGRGFEQTPGLAPPTGNCPCPERGNGAVGFHGASAAQRDLLQLLRCPIACRWGLYDGYGLNFHFITLFHGQLLQTFT